MTEELLIRHCAPTLAGLKVGALVNTDFPDDQAFADWIASINALLAPKGVAVRELRSRPGRALLYVYRPKQLAKILDNPEAREILAVAGYADAVGIEEHLNRLASKLSDYEDFPHEIGLFLGYPPADVQGFIQHKGAGAKACGIWKVYSNVDAAMRSFRKFRKCNAVYAMKWREGLSLSRLTVAI